MLAISVNNINTINNKTDPCIFISSSGSWHRWTHVQRLHDVFKTFFPTSLGSQWPTSHRETGNHNWHVVITINDHSTQSSSTSGEQGNLTVLEWSVQTCEINQVWGQQWCSPKQHGSRRLKNGRDYSRLWSVPPAQGRLCWHFCSCWPCEGHEGDLSRCWTACATWVNWSSKHKVTAECSVCGQAVAGLGSDMVPWQVPAYESKCHSHKIQNWFNINCWLKVV